MTSTASPTTDTDYVVPEQRLQLPRLAADSYRATLALSRSITLDKTLRHLIEIRVSQINGCAYCLDMHSVAAREHGETTQRLDTLAGWRESPLFTARERAALELSETLTRLADRGSVPDAVYERVAEHFDDAELAQLAFAIAEINTWNRLVLTAQTRPPTR